MASEKEKLPIHIGLNGRTPTTSLKSRPGAYLDQVQPVAEELPAAPQLLAGHVAGWYHVCA